MKISHTAVTVVVGAGLKPAPTEIVGIDKSWAYHKSMKSAVRPWFYMIDQRWLLIVKLFFKQLKNSIQT